MFSKEMSEQYLLPSIHSVPYHLLFTGGLKRLLFTKDINQKSWTAVTTILLSSSSTDHSSQRQ